MGIQTKTKVIHLIVIKYGYECRAACSPYSTAASPIEATIIGYKPSDISKGTFNPEKVTCKRCLKHSDYKKAQDKIKYPLFFWRENI